MARRVKSFQAFRPFFNVTKCIAARCVSIHVKAPILFLLRHLLKRFHAIFGLRPLGFRLRSTSFAGQVAGQAGRRANGRTGKPVYGIRLSDK
ncbi:hypothetical protein D3OALGA1CA_3889 [Olavius algarvensis associated proteobacterium Delta 3]|nr:hypothetical protein D3OALGA1CA_3889 [Olavius algarvensis associated proteobacterium Delta 3]CAB5167072.1 hypothetical protein D3OALGB2SA_5838 [Olavius algarvensis associated proteobacterium Delta 3]